MRKRINYYKELAADYSKPVPVSADLAKKLLDDAARFIAMKEKIVTAVSALSLRARSRRARERKRAAQSSAISSAAAHQRRSTGFWGRASASKP